MKLPDPAERPTLTVTEMAEIIGVGRAKAYEMVKREQVPAIRAGRQILIPTHALREWLGAKTTAHVEAELTQKLASILAAALRAQARSLDAAAEAMDP